MKVQHLRRGLVRVTFGATAGVLLLGSSCGRRDDPELLARIGSREIRVVDVQRSWAAAQAQGRSISQKDLLDELVERALLLGKAEELGLDQVPEIQRARDNLLIGELKRRQLEPKLAAITVTEADIEQYYQAHRDDYSQPPARRLAVLQQQIHPSASGAKRDRVRESLKEARERSLAQLAHESGFGELALRYSDDQASRYRGGDLGWVEVGRNDRWDEAVVQAGFELVKPGDVSQILETTNRFYLIKLEEIRAGRVTGLAQVATAIRQRVIREKREQVQQDFAQTLRSATPPEIFPERLSDRGAKSLARVPLGPAPPPALP